jgi:nitronate monooxygenase
VSVLERLAAPIVLAPMAGGPSTPELAAAVAGAGGLGFLAAGYRSVDQVRGELDAVRRLTDRPCGINLFANAPLPADDEAIAAYARRLEPEARRLGARPGTPRWDDDGYAAKLRLVLAERPAVVSFTFGCPDADTIATLRDAGVEAWVTVTHPAEAAVAVARGVDAIVAQGVEAGGHRGTWDDSDAGDVPLLELVRSTSGLGVPVVATGGIGDGEAARETLAAGASAVQLGSAFLLAPEAGTHRAHRALLQAGRETAITRAFTGRRARGIVNRFLLDHSGDAPSGYPQVHHLTGPLRAAARQAGDAEAFNLWAGTRHGLARPEPAAAVVLRLSAELDAGRG